MLEAASAHVPISEGRALWQHLILDVIRIPMLALGRKLGATGALDNPNDVFFLTISELIEAANNPTPSTKQTVARRSADFEASADLKPPPFLGSQPDISKLPPEVAAGVGPLMHLFFGADPPNVEGKSSRVRPPAKASFAVAPA